ncbi:hypothetical protein [Butyricimonas virosa]|uniref:hypothetical protein n=1 Tax=Butyricimonas virosa TaxID=544645 RepID=UPI002430C297|nr:hypothetical protein [Butyricimonas virosa]
MGTTINIKPGKFRIPVVIPRSGIDAISVMGLDNRKKYIYSGLIVADTIDGYILELINDTKRCNLYRQGFKGSLNEMKRRIDKYKSIMYDSVCITESSKRELTSNLDILDDEFGNDIKILFHSIKRYVQGFIDNTDHVTCIARASIINVLSGYSIMNDEKVSRIMSKVMMRDVCLDDVNIKAINFESKKFTGYFASIYSEVDIDLNNCNEIFTAFSIIDKKMNKIHEILKQTA